MFSAKKIAVVGLWHCGEIYSACLAELGHDVTGIDENTDTTANLQKGIPPLEEPELAEMIAKNSAAGRLRFSIDFSETAKTSIVWFTYDTSVNDEDVVDIIPIITAVEKIAPFLQNGTTVIFSSQLPVGTIQKIKELVTTKRPELKFDIAYVPENLQLGKATRSFMEPGRIVIGAENEKTFALIENIFALLKTQFFRMNPTSAEMAKHALNAFLATSLTFIYDIADLCEKVGADVTDVTKALKSDPRIGQSAYLDASVGFSGGTLGRDLRAMMNEADRKNITLPIISNVYAKNAGRRSIFIARIKETLGGLNGKTIGLLGVTYKVGTSTLRRSLALEVAGLLKNEGVAIHATDPMAKKEEVEAESNIQFFSDPYEMMERCHAVILMTAWPEYKELDVTKVAKAIKEPRAFFDTRNFLKDKETEFKKAGIKYTGIGR
ncbi:MAG: nucleotide sugar dehydrogenase [bacterium]|nr:nucleotide sugar dehydrogenase [bacterium]